jgi:glucose/arabinose dehydrogenase
MSKRHGIAAALLAVTMVVGFAAPASAHNRHDDNQSEHHDGDNGHHHGHNRHHHGNGGGQSGQVTVVADNLNNPRQVTVNDGAVYVAEAGTGGDTCFGTGQNQACVGFTGSVTEVDRHGAERVQTGLLSVASPEGDTVGLDSLAFRHDRMYGVVTGTCDVPPGAPTEITDQLGKVLKLDGGPQFETVGDPGAFECANDPDGQGPDTDPYGIAVTHGTIYVADAAGNDIVKVDKDSGTVSLAAVVSNNSQPVPTSLAWGPDGNLYIGTLNFEGGPGGASVYKLDVQTDTLSVYASGLTFITGLNFGCNGDLYVSEFSTGFDPTTMAPLPNGDVVKIPWGGGTDGRETIGTGSLHFPTGVAYLNGALYVSNWGIAPGTDTTFGPGAHGQLVKITL